MHYRVGQFDKTKMAPRGHHFSFAERERVTLKGINFSSLPRLPLLRCGKGEIRTLDTLSGMPLFVSGAPPKADKLQPLSASGGTRQSFAEAGGFEPPILLRVYRISSAAYSTSLARFHHSVVQENGFQIKGFCCTIRREKKTKRLWILLRI